MSEEINDIVQIIRITHDGIMFAIKTGSASVTLVKKAASLITGMLDHEKVMGKTNLKGLLEKGGDLQVLSFADSDMKKFKKSAKKYGILYSVMPGAEKGSGFTEVMFHSEAVPRMGMVCQDLSGSRISSLGSFLEEDGGKKADNILSYLKKENGKDTEGHARIQEPEARYYNEIGNRIKQSAVLNNENLVDITISKKMVTEENSHAVKTRIPGTYGENAAYIWFSREDLMEVHGGKSLLAFLDKNREYNIYSDGNQVIRTIQGEQLYREHYDEVEKAVRSAYKKTAEKTKTIKRKQTGRWGL